MAAQTRNMSLATSAPKLSRRARVLVVDDETVNRTVAVQLCTMFGAEVETASSGAEAIERCDQAVFDLILMDIRMAGLDGVQATAAIRSATHAGKDTPVIAVTADGSRALEARCAGVGISVVIQKPLQMKTFFSAIESTLQSTRTKDFTERKSGDHQNELPSGAFRAA